MSQYYDAFISYGRADSKAFAIKLYQDLTEAGLKIWFDQNDIPLAVDFQNQIDDGIEKARNFLFIIGPHSVNSPYCLKEIELAVKYKKRIIPLLHVEEITSETWQERNQGKTEADWEEYREKGLHSCFPNMHPEIGRINWVYFRENVDNYDESLAGLIKTFHKHEDCVQKHTQILTQALQWERHQKLTRYLLVGKERLEAENWLKIEFTNEQPPCLPTDLHCEFICESIKNANNLLTKVFLSHAEADRETMLKIRTSLMRHGITVWTNQTDIKTGSEFQQAINRGIEGADNLVYLLSQAALESLYCQQELAHAFSLNKRIIFLLIKPTVLETMPREVQELQFLDLTLEEEYQKNLDKLIKILGENAVYYEGHKTLLVKALKWQEQNRNASILLRGYNLERYQSWLEVAEKKQLHPPTDLQKEFIAESAKQPPDLALDVFVSYSRADSDFARRLNDALQTQGKTTWFDQESIATGTDFQQEIYRGIEQSDNFLFVISPDSVNSPYCADEVEYARSLKKRFVTVLHRPVNSEELHPELAKVQRLDFNKHGGDFYGNFSELVRTLDTDREYVREHTKKSQMALEWQRGNKTIDLLLRGSEYARAYEWWRSAQTENKQPGVSKEIEEFILESKAEAERLQKAQRRRKNTVAAAAVGTIVFLSGLSIVAWGQKLEAQRQSEIAFARQLAAESQVTLAYGGLQQRATLLAVESMKKFKKLDRPSVAADSAVRKSLSLLPRFISEMKHERSVNAVAFSADGKYLATASSDRGARVWDVVPGEEVARLDHDDEAIAIAFSADGKYVASGSWDNTARVWNAATGEEVAVLDRDAPVFALAFSADGKYLATAARQDDTVWVWEASTGKKVAALEHDSIVSAVAFSADGKYVATASYDGIARVWDAIASKKAMEVKHDGIAMALALSADGKYLATAMGENAIGVWDAATGEAIAQLKHNDTVVAVAFSADGKYLATGSWDNTARVWESRTGEEVANLAHYGPVFALAFSPDGQYLATTSEDNVARVWESSTGEEVAKLDSDRKISAVAFSPQGKYLVTASYDGIARVWEPRAGKEVANLSHERPVEAVVFSPDGKYLATASRDNTARVWNALAGTEIARLSHERPVNTVAFSADGEYLATASDDNTARVWDSATGTEIARLSHEGPLEAVAFSPDGKYLATASDDNTARVWESKTGAEVVRLSHERSVNAVAFSADGKYLATASDDKTARVWESRTGKEVALLSHDDSVNAVTFSAEGKYLATVSNNNAARVWDARTYEELAKLHHDWYINAIAFSADGNYLATASSDYTARVWESDTGKEVAKLSHDREVIAVAFSPDSKYVATASWDNTARVHFLKPQDLINEVCRRLSRNLTADEWERYMNLDLDQYQKTCDSLPVHPSLAAIGRELAKGGKVKEAIAIFRRVLKLEPDMDLNPDTKEIENDPEAVARELAGDNEE